MLPTRAIPLALIIRARSGSRCRKAVEGGVVALDPSRIQAAQAAFGQFAAKARGTWWPGRVFQPW